MNIRLIIDWIKSFFKWLFRIFLKEEPEDVTTDEESSDKEIPDEEVNNIVLQVNIYDPLAANGLYEQWEQSGDGETEKTGESTGRLSAKMPATGIYWRLYEVTDQADERKMLTSRKTDETGALEFHEKDGITPDRTYLIEYGGTENTIDPSSENGNLPDMSFPGEPPEQGKRFYITTPGSYEVLIWLRPKALVLHWTAGGHQADNAHSRTSYHFLVDGNGRWLPGGWRPQPEQDEWTTTIHRSANGKSENEIANIDREADRSNPQLWQQSWRIWWHNLRLRGLPDLTRSESVLLRTGEAGSSRPFFWNRENGRYPVDPAGYLAHAGGFNTNTVAVSFCGMFKARNEPSGWNPSESDDFIPLQKKQMLSGLAKVAELCRAWQLDPTDPNRLCTHYEVDHIHTDRKQKWDITWLPPEMAGDYKIFRDRVDRNEESDVIKEKYENLESDALCEDEAGLFQRYNDIPLDPPGHGWKSAYRQDLSQHYTDRVSDYLRELVKRQQNR